MTHEEKINYMRIAAGLCQFAIRTQELDMLVRMYELVLEKKGNTALDDMVHVQYEIEQKYEKQEKDRIKKQMKV